MRKDTKRALANGCFSRGRRKYPTTGSCRLCVDFPKDMFGELRALALKHDCSLNEAVRTAITWGLEGAQS